MKEFGRRISRNAPKIEKGKQVIDSNEFSEERNRSLEEWDKNEECNSGNLVGDCDVDYNHELESEKQTNIEIDESQLENTQYGLSRVGGKASI